MEIIDHPLIIMFRTPEKNIECRIHPDPTDDYRGYGLLICDLVRHVANCFGVHEDAVWHWIEKERAKPTTTLSGGFGGPKQ